MSDIVRSIRFDAADYSVLTLPIIAWSKGP
jgi:hypothetical protein